MCNCYPQKSGNTGIANAIINACYVNLIPWNKILRNGVDDAMMAPRQKKIGETKNEFESKAGELKRTRGSVIPSVLIF